jgi:hypothetical protein
MPVQGSDDVVNPWKAQSTVYELNVWGNPEKLPRHSWAVDVSVAFGGSISYNK